MFPAATETISYELLLYTPLGKQMDRHYISGISCLCTGYIPSCLWIFRIQNYTARVNESSSSGVMECLIPTSHMSQCKNHEREGLV